MKKCIILSLGVLCAGTSVNAQQNLSLSDAIQMGLTNNYDIQIERGNVEVDRNNNTIGEAGRWPTVTLNVNQNNSLTDNVRTAFPTFTQGQVLSNSVTPGVNVNWTVFNGFKVNITKRRLDLLQAETEGNASIVIANTLQSIILGYYLAVLETERLEEFSRQLDLSRDKYEFIKIKSELGGAVSSDLLLEEGNYLTDSINFINQQLTLRNAIRNLNLLLVQKEPVTNYNFTDTLQVPVEEYEYRALKSKMLDTNVDLKKQYITQSILGQDAGLRKADQYPNLSFAAGFTENRNSLGLSEARFFTGSGFSNGPNRRLKSTTDTYFANFALSFTLFDGGKIKRAIRSAIINENIGQLKVEKLKTSLDGDLIAALDQYNIRRQLHGINSRRVEAAQINLDISQEKYRNGSINSFNYRDVQNNYLSSAILKLQAAYNLINSKVEIMRLTGGLIREYNQ